MAAEECFRDSGKRPSRFVQFTKRVGPAVAGVVGLTVFEAACTPPPAAPPAITQEAKDPSSPIALKEATATPNPTATPECDPVKFAKEQGVPTPYPRGGVEATDELTLQAVKISKKLERCEKLTPEEMAILVKYNLEYDEPPVSVPVKPAATATEAPKPSATPIPEKTPEDRKKEALALTDKIISEIKNPPKEVMEKYGITPEDIAKDNMILIYGSDPTALRETTGKEYDPDRSLLGVKAYIEKGNSEKALKTLKWVFTIASNGALKDRNAPNIKGKTVAEIDPKRVFYPTNAPDNGRDYVSVHREEATYDMIALMYPLKGQDFPSVK